MNKQPPSPGVQIRRRYGTSHRADIAIQCQTRRIQSLPIKPEERRSRFRPPVIHNKRVEFHIDITPDAFQLRDSA
jgi:hypothetical protein